MSNPRKKRAFQPVGLDALEDRTVMSTGAAHPLSAVSALANSQHNGGGQNLGSSINNQNSGGQTNSGGQNNGQTQMAVDAIVNAQVRQDFSQFATNYFGIEGAYFAHLRDSSTGIDYPTFQSQVEAQVKNLAVQVVQAVNNVPGGAGSLSDFVVLRLVANQPGSLYYDLTHNLPPVDSSTGMTSGGFDMQAGASIQAALLDTQNLTTVYNNTLGFAVGNFLNGTYHFFNTEMYAKDLPSSPGTGSPGSDALQAIDNLIYQQFGQFSDQYYPALSTYLDSVKNGTNNGNGDIDTFRTTVTGLVQSLSNNVVGVINKVPGGGAYLASILQAKLGSNLPGSLLYNLTNIPAASNTATDGSSVSTALSADTFALIANTDVQRAATSSVLFTNLYNVALNDVATGFFNQYYSQYIQGSPGGVGNNLGNSVGNNLGNGIGNNLGSGVGNNLGNGLSGTSMTGNGTVSAQAVGFGSGLNFGQTGFAANPYSGVGLGSFAYNPYNGYGGLGGGYNLGYGVFNTGFGATNLYGYGLGYGTGYGLGNSYGLYAGTAGIGTGTMGLGFGGFYF